MSGAPDLLYVRARAALLDAAEADMISASFTTLVSDLLAVYQCRLRGNRLFRYQVDP